ncbi:MAG: AMP-binding protein [Gammaproteobacteria bacterium]|nr:AMP-binding protein [Gammaproteobacteria bacterium]
MTNGQNPSITNLTQLFHRTLMKYPGGSAYRWFDEQKNSWRACSWADAFRRTCRIRMAFSELTPGQRVALILPNSPDWVCISQAVLSKGGQIVPIIPSTTLERLIHVLKETRPQYLFIDDSLDDEYIRRVSRVLPECQIVSVGTRARQQVVIAMSEWMIADVKAGGETYEARPDDVAFILYSAGKNGIPRGVLITHGCILQQLQQLQLRTELSERDSIFCTEHFSFSYALISTLYLAMQGSACVIFPHSTNLFKDFHRLGATVIIGAPGVFDHYQRAFQADLSKRSHLRLQMFRFMRVISQWRFKSGKWAYATLMLPAVAFFCRALMRQIARRFNGSSLRLKMVVGASASCQFYLDQFCTGGAISAIYGLTEVGPLVAINQQPYCANHIGEFVGGVEWKLDDNGELLLRGGSVASRYISGKAVRKHGWLPTGDRLRRSGDRYYLDGRVDASIRLSTGEYVYPRVIEDQLTKDELFTQVVVLGHGREFLSAMLFLEKSRLAALMPARNTSDSVVELNAYRLRDFLSTRVRLALMRLPHAWQIKDFLVYDQSCLKPEWFDDEGRLMRDMMIDAMHADIVQLYQPPHPDTRNNSRITTRNTASALIR